MSSSIKCRFRLCLSIALMAVFSIAVSAQFRGGLQGTVTDTNGAIIPNAVVTLTNIATNASLDVTSNDSGYFSFASLAPGTYRLVVSKTGFKKAVVENIAVSGEIIQGLDPKLEAGDVTAEVVVPAGEVVTTLDTETPNIGRNITSKEVLDLPQVGRDPYQLARLSPGVFGDGGRSSNGQSARIGNNGSGPGGSNNGIFAVENQVQISANGQRVTSNGYTIDGVSVNSQTWGGAAVITPTQESIEEVQVTSSTYSAEDGRNSGALVKVISKQGNNDWHGSAFLKINNPGLNAYNKFYGVPNIPGLSDAQGRPNIAPVRVGDKFKTYGGSFGGRLVRDKLFFFGAWEGTKNTTNSVTTGTFVETAAFRNALATLRSGTLSARFLANGVEPRIAQVLTPSCSLLNAPYSGGGTNCQVVGNGLDIGSITGTYGTYVPDATNAIGGGLDGIADLQFVTLQGFNSFKGNQYTLRVDYQATEKDKLTFTSYFTPLTTSSFNTPAQSRPQADLTSDRLTYLVGGIYTRAISSTLFNEARFNYTKWGFHELESNPDTDWGLPRVEIEAMFSDRLRFGAPRADTTPGDFNQTQMDLRNSLTKVWGNHLLKFGIEYRKEVNNSASPGGARPLYSFTRIWNFANGTPVFQSINADANGNPKANDIPFNTKNIAGFVQDNWKIRSDVTLNLGLRWEYFAPISVSDGNVLGRFELGPSGGVADGRIVQVTSLTDKDLNNFGPQIGFAWSPSRFDGKAVLRGGFGIGFDRLASALLNNARFAPPNAARYGICCGNSANAGNTGATTGTIQFVASTDGTIYGYPRNPTIGGGFAANGGPNFGTVEIYGAPRDFPNAYVYRYSLEGQYELPAKFVATLGYQGSSGRNFARILPLHLINPTTTALNLRPVFYATPDVDTNYNAMLAGLKRRFADTFSLNANYRFSKSLDNVSLEAPCGCTNQTYPIDNRTEYGPSDFDVTHYINVSGTWEPNWFRGRKDIAGDFLSGWSFSPIVTWRSGFPWTPVIGQGLTTGSTIFSINPIRPRSYYGTPPLGNSNSTFLSGGLFPNNIIRNSSGAIVPCNNPTTTPGGCSNYFLTTINGNLYQNNPPGVGRNVFRGPRYFSVDLSLVKRISLAGTGFFGEAASLDLRFNFFNLFNNLNLAPFTAGSNSTRADNPQFGVATTGLAGRVGEFQARFSF